MRDDIIEVEIVRKGVYRWRKSLAKRILQIQITTALLAANFKDCLQMAGVVHVVLWNPWSV